MDVLKRIEELREQRDWSLYNLARQSDLSLSTLTGLYKRNNQPSIQTLESICKGFGITMSQFFAIGQEPVALRDEQRELLKAWDSLPPEIKEGLWAMINTFNKKK